ncbi:MAG TPA: class I SAM-dependent methyltransferase [Solirubrobacteraceae bacterium]|jgi:SAM-dependent methyltransferase|nr:class I SAM-dependent methyltransferase [Solirubrobacteraceae bacterium]
MAGPASPRNVFSRAAGPLPRLAEPLSNRARARRLALFRSLARVTQQTRIVDIGCGSLGLLGQAPDLNITGVDLYPRPDYPGTFVQADATRVLPFADHEFELAYTNSVIEHLHPDAWGGFAREVRRVARGWWVQTPAMSFPIEPHSLLPAAHWLPRPIRDWYWKLGAGSNVAEIHILRRHELEALFGPALAEKLGPLTKSWIAFQPPAKHVPSP